MVYSRQLADGFEMLSDEPEPVIDHMEQEQTLRDALDVVLCPKCGKPMEQKHGRFGWFWGCSGYPVCKVSHKSLSDEDD